MTPFQSQVLAAVRDLTADGVPPSYRQIAAHVGRGLQSVQIAIDCLVADGRLIRSEGRWRSLRIPGPLDAQAFAQMSHADLLAMREQIDRRLGVAA